MEDLFRRRRWLWEAVVRLARRDAGDVKVAWRNPAFRKAGGGGYRPHGRPTTPPPSEPAAIYPFNEEERP